MHNTAHIAASYTQAHTAQACVCSVVHSYYAQCAVYNAAQYANMHTLTTTRNTHMHAFFALHVAFANAAAAYSYNDDLLAAMLEGEAEWEQWAEKMLA